MSMPPAIRRVRFTVRLELVQRLVKSCGLRCIFRRIQAALFLVDSLAVRPYTRGFIGVGGPRKGKPVAPAKSGEEDNALHARKGS